MRYAVRIFLLLFILGIICVGCYMKLDSKTKTERSTGTYTVEALAEFYTGNDCGTRETPYMESRLRGYQRIAAAFRTEPAMEEWIVIGENALPCVPGRIYVQKTESTANIWHTTRAVANAGPGESLALKQFELSERQRLHLLNTGAVPKGWEVVYVDENGNLTP